MNFELSLVNLENKIQIEFNNFYKKYFVRKDSSQPTKLNELYEMTTEINMRSSGYMLYLNTCRGRDIELTE